MRYSFFVGALIINIGLAAGAAPATNPPPRIYRDKIEPHWFADGAGATNRFWYRLNLAHDEKEFVIVEAAAGKREPAFDAERMAKALAAVTGGTVDPKKPPFDSLSFSTDGKSVTLSGEGSEWNLNLETYVATAVTKSGANGNQLRAGRTIHPSRTSDDQTETSIHFINRLDQEVNVFWLDENGERQAYGSLKPTEERDQHTFVGHAWLIAAHNGDLISVYDAGNQPGVAIIGATNAAPQFSRRQARAESTLPERIASPDKRWEVFARDFNIFLRDTRDGSEQQLSQDGNPDNGYTRMAEFERAVNMDFETKDPEHATPEVYWSPDSRHFVAMRFKAGSHRRVYEVESSPKDQLQPKLTSYPYLKGGRRCAVHEAASF